ncbi:uncharacterized protein LOC122672458 [Telopea speciosissima]|uniref:uncharacterized protein LOC122672458 n=1 Tax=Telopea speciosissima TaxID=54955 RepID=UPI001CC7E658|nr:uncharacterized protein LOC122672458 [Telopea speciosissima]
MSSQQSYLPKIVKLDFPRYNGGDDTITWIYRVEQFFAFHQTPEEERVALASFHLEGEAQLWYQLYKQSDGGVTWADFCEGLHARFGLTPFQDFFGELAKLQQTSSVRDYQAKFERILSKVGQLPPNRQISCFVSGLRDNIKVDVLAAQPATLSSAIGLARLFEAKNLSMRRSFPPAEPRKFMVGNKEASNGGNTLPIKRMSIGEMQERRAKGLCYNCNEHFVPGHRCKCGPEEEEETTLVNDVAEEVEEIPEISLHAICGVKTPETMRVVGRLGHVAVTVLVDSGSTHNFLSLKVAKKVGISPTNQQPFEVMVASREKISSPGMCKNVSLNVQGVTIVADFFLLALGGYEAVLGAHWLQTLGPITWDFANLIMKYEVAGKEVTLTRISAGMDKIIEDPTRETRRRKQGLLLHLCSILPTKTEVEPTSAHLHKLLNRFKEIFDEPKGLPPTWLHDHRIPLKANSQPTCVKAYHHPYLKKKGN